MKLTQEVGQCNADANVYSDTDADLLITQNRNGPVKIVCTYNSYYIKWQVGIGIGIGNAKILFFPQRIIYQKLEHLC